MCRSTGYLGCGLCQPNQLSIKVFHLKLSLQDACDQSLPDSLTLLYLPWTDRRPLEINGLKIRPNTPGFITLHRVVKVNSGYDVEFCSRERVQVSEGVQFEVYAQEEVVFKGTFRRDEHAEWKMDCECVPERKMVGIDVQHAELCVAAESTGKPLTMREKVEVLRRQRRSLCFKLLEEIPEGREVDAADSEETELESDGAWQCYCDGLECGSKDVDDDCDEHWTGMEKEMETEMEGVRWAVDVGIWVVCLGVGYLVSKASSRSLWHNRLA